MPNKNPMKKLLLILTILATGMISAQEKLVAKNGKITFEASVPSFEEVKATNAASTFVLNPKTGEFASLALMKGFRFKVALMEEHFNENYIESDKFPKATFRGKLEGFDYASVTASGKEYVAKGTLELHGKTKEVNVPVRLKKTASGLEGTMSFSVNASDFAIAIPSVVKSKVSNKVNVSAEFTLK